MQPGGNRPLGGLHRLNRILKDEGVRLHTGINSSGQVLRRDLVDAVLNLPGPYKAGQILKLNDQP
jgi:hypothetical protein